jgi:hypothetical protein
MPISEEIWAAFLLLLGAALLVFNERWAAWAAPQVPYPFTGRVVLGRLLTVLVGLMLAGAGASAFLAPH